MYVNQLNTPMFQMYVNRVYFYCQKIIDNLVILWDESAFFVSLICLLVYIKINNAFSAQKYKSAQKATITINNDFG